VRGGLQGLRGRESEALGWDKTAEEVKEALATLDSARRRASMDKARLKAQETLQAKRQRRTIVLDSKAGAASGSVAPA
jgi:hypothetical protein